jgi:hypothetical protein
MRSADERLVCCRPLIYRGDKAVRMAREELIVEAGADRAKFDAAAIPFEKGVAAAVCTENSEANRVRKKHNRAIIAADVRRFCHQIKRTKFSAHTPSGN